MPKFFQLNRIFSILLFLVGIYGQSFGQDEEVVFSLKGTIKSGKTQQPISYANVSLKNHPIGINANEEGKFELNLETIYKFDTISF